MPRYPTLQVDPKLKEQVQVIVTERGGMSLLTRRTKLPPTTIKRVLQDQPIAVKSMKKLSRGLKLLGKPLDHTEDVEQPMEPADIIEQYEAISTAAQDFLKHFSNGTEKLLGTGEAKQAYVRLQEAIKRVA